MKSQTVGCCGAKTWTQVIGILQAFTYGLLTCFTLIVMILLEYEYYSGEDSGHSSNNTSELKYIHRLLPEDTKISLNRNSPPEIVEDEILMFVCIMIFLGVFLALFIFGSYIGVILFRGVNERSAGKLETWIIARLIFIITLTVVSPVVVYYFPGSSIMFMIAYGIAMVYSLFCMWVVNIHRQELLGRSAGEIIHSNDNNEGMFSYN